ncbi:MAG: DNA polymerase III subunit delta [Acidobacteriota bacterium]|nr:DNA polymerase III subunit delta [Blastocatellia bacterium]MDW8412305.1 DNA polymerase III subunit delta [Acidobacteriota bacterium]
MSYAELEKKLSAGKIAQLYLLYGQETFLRKEALALLRRAVLRPETEAFNYSEVSLHTDGIAKFLSLAREYPMFSERRMVVVTDFEKINEQAFELLKAYLKNPQLSTTVVFYAESIDKRYSVTSALIRSCEVYELAILKERDAIRWAINYARSNGYTLLPAAAELLIATTGTELFTVKNALEKLIAALANQKEISTQDVQLTISRSREHELFELADALVDAEQEKVCRLAARLLFDGTEPLAILAVVARVLRQLLVVKLMSQSKSANEDIAKQAGMPPFKLASFLAGARKWEQKQIEHGLRRAAEVDDAIKNSLGKPQLQIEFYLCELFLKP